jgi:hypothetical protein
VAPPEGDTCHADVAQVTIQTDVTQLLAADWEDRTPRWFNHRLTCGAHVAVLVVEPDYLLDLYSGMPRPLLRGVQRLALK